MPSGIIHSASMGGRITTKERNQTIMAAAVLGGAYLGVRAPPGIQVRLLNFGVKSYAAFVAMGDAYPALGPNYKFGIRYGGTGEVTTLAKALPITQMYGGASKYIPVPDFGFGITAVPNTSSRWVYENNKSRPGEHTGRTSRVAGPLQTDKSMSGASAKKTVRRSRRSKPARRLRATKWCRRHKRYDRCK